MNNKKWYEQLTAMEIEKTVKNEAWKIVYSVRFDSTLDEIENAYDELCDYENSLKDLISAIVDKKTAYYMMNTKVYQEWDNCLMEFRGKIFEYKEQLGNMYLSLNRERKAQLV